MLRKTSMDKFAAVNVKERPLGCQINNVTRTGRTRAFNAVTHAAHEAFRPEFRIKQKMERL